MALSRLPLRLGASRVALAPLGPLGSSPLTCGRLSARVLRPSIAATRHATSSSSSSAPQPPPHKSTMTRNGVVAAVLLAASVGVYYYEQRVMGVDILAPLEKKDEFTVHIGRRNGAQGYTFTRKPDAEVEQMLHVNESTASPGRPGNPVARWDTNYVASNEPCEDRSATDVVPRGPARSWWPWGASSTPVDEPGKRDIVLISVIDGHAGWATSQLLSKTLHPTLSLALAGVQAGIVPGANWGTKVWDVLTWAKTWSPPNIGTALQSAYVQLDDNICNTPVRLLPSLLTDESKEMRAKFCALTRPAAAGAVVVSAVVDAENDGLYVAVTGDCRAVAGWQAEDGSWRCDVLSEDQMGENPKEVARMRAEHPSYEADTVIRNGRVQGGLQPTRAFGDAIYKWTTAQGEAIAAVYADEGEKVRPPRAFHYTPPYVTARPEVEYRPLRKAGERLRFVVMATDGLWDGITSEEATILMAAYLEQPKRNPVSKTALATEIPVESTQPRPYPIQEMPGEGKRGAGEWAFEGDANAATHLIRNALGGADRKHRGEMLSLHGKVARWFRDDMTVTVVFFDE